MPSDRSVLIRLASSLPVGSPVRKVILRKVAEGEAKSDASFLKFMDEVGDQKVKNPDTGNEVKVKSLKGEKGQKLVQEQFQKWLKSKEKGGDKEKDDKPKGKDEGKEKKDEGKKDDKPWEGKPEGLSEAVASSATAFLKEYGDSAGVSFGANVTHLLKTVPKSALKDQASLDKYRNDGDFWKMGKEGEEWDELLSDVGHAIQTIQGGSFRDYDDDEADRNLAAWKAFLEGKDTTDQMKKDHTQAKKDKADKKKKDEDAEVAEEIAMAKKIFIDEKVKEEKRWRKKQRNRPKAWQDLPKEDEDYIREEAEKEWGEKEKERGKKASSDRTHLIRLASSLPLGSKERRVILAELAKTPAGAKKLYDKYRAEHPATKKGPKDFYEPKAKGDGEKSEKAKSKGEKGQEKTDKRREEKEKDEYAYKHWALDDVKKVIQKGPEAVRDAAHEIMKYLEVDPEEEGVDVALAEAKEQMGTDQKYEFARALLSKHKKNQSKKASSDRKTLIRLASSLPVGSPERRAVLAGLKRADGDTEMAIQQVVGKLTNDRTIKKYLAWSKDLEGGKVKKIRLDDGMRMLVITLAEQYPGISFFVTGNKGGKRSQTLAESRQGIPARGSISKVFSPIMKAVKEWVEEGKDDLLKAASIKDMKP